MKKEEGEVEKRGIDVINTVLFNEIMFICVIKIRSL